MHLSPRQAGRLAEHILGEQRDEGAEAAVGNLPQRIGHCRIRRLIAAGGMGVVYEAEQENPRRTVAVKVMSRQFAARGRLALRRFEYEAQILARLDHPGIAKIYEAGTWDDGSGGVPYFVMEFIPRARNLIEFVEAYGLSRRQRLQLFARVCDAVHHGHQKGIIHRDLKPANIMVQEPISERVDRTAVEETPQPKVIDFGVARAADTDISVTTMHTKPGDIVGTLQYMSPEQCDGDPHAIDVRSDVYALGVILYELLCGRLPYDLSNTPIPRATRIVQEQTPHRPGEISPSLKGDLEAITLKAIEKQPAQRYQSAADLAADVRRHLAGEPIDARPPAAWTRTIQFLGRHPVFVTGCVCLTVLLMTFAATWVSVWYLNFRPHRMELTPDGREARLISYGGKLLHTWTSSERRGITFARLVLGDGTRSLAVVGFNHHQDNPWPGSLCAFDPFNDRDNPVWARRITEADLIPDLQGEIDPAGFGLQMGMIEDVFADNPGLEIITSHSHVPSSPGVISIYDTSGELLYRVWHNAAPGSGYWMHDERLLVLTTLNSEVYWARRGHPEVEAPHPVVVFALKPRLGYIGRTWTTPSPGGETATLAWYRCVLPPEASAELSLFHVGRPLPPYDPGRFVTFGLELREERGGISWVLDAKGKEVPGTRTPNNSWRTKNPLPVGYFRLGDLPPIVPAPRKK